LATHASVAIETQKTRKTLTESRDRLVDDAASATQFIGDHSTVEVVRDSANKVARTDLTVLVLGQNGTGKEVLARYIHYQSQRRSGPFIAVNCAALVESLLESELFGHEKGAFTDANQTRIGKFELASGGTLFLDEVGDMSPGGQAKLLRVLEEKVVVRVGGSKTIPVDVRVIAATNQPLEELISQKRFRQDLFFRLNVVSLTLPPLHQRGDDILTLADHFFEEFCYQIGRQVPRLDSSARQALLSHPWPGNIRELRNTIERVCYLTGGDSISAGDLMLDSSPAARVSRGATASAITLPVLADATRQFQVQHIEAAIEACRGNMTDAAARLGLHRSNLYRKMRQLGMSGSDEQNA
jgi:DNA-binding NtrC family response regulator